MNEIMEATEQTPIEIALGIDADGMTTARKLYSFLELAPQHFARWCKKNIIENDFATENEDYMRLTTNGETPTGGKVEREDYRLTAQFAKKLSMMSKSERGEQARDYFTSVEDKAKEMIVAMREASKDPMKMLKLHYQAVEQVDKKVDHAIGKVDALEERFDKMERDMPVFTIDAKNIQSAVRKRGIEVMGGKDSNAYKDNRVRGSVYSDIQSTLKRNFGVRKYEEIKHQQVDIALDIIAAYEPPYILKEKVNYINSQLNLF
ncbi:MAG: ORF6C domain-containing protein [Dorea formicigenerans]